MRHTHLLTYEDSILIIIELLKSKGKLSQVSLDNLCSLLLIESCNLLEKNDESSYLAVKSVMEGLTRYRIA